MDPFAPMRPKRQHRQAPLPNYRFLVQETDFLKADFPAMYRHPPPSTDVLVLPPSTDVLLEAMQRKQRLQVMSSSTPPHRQQQHRQQNDLENRKKPTKKMMESQVLRMMRTVLPPLDRQVIQRSNAVPDFIDLSKRTLFLPHLDPKEESVEDYETWKPSQSILKQRLHQEKATRRTCDRTKRTVGEVKEEEQDFSKDPLMESLRSLEIVSSSQRQSPSQENAPGVGQDSYFFSPSTATSLHESLVKDNFNADPEGEEDLEGQLKQQQLKQQLEEDKVKKEEWEGRKRSVCSLLQQHAEASAEQHRLQALRTREVDSLQPATPPELSSFTWSVVRKVAQERKKFLSEESAQKFIETAMVGDAQDPFQTLQQQQQQQKMEFSVQRDEVRRGLRLRLDEKGAAAQDMLYIEKEDVAVLDRQERPTPPAPPAAADGSSVRSLHRFQTTLSTKATIAPCSSSSSSPSFLSTFLSLANHKRLTVGGKYHRHISTAAATTRNNNNHNNNNEDDDDKDQDDLAFMSDLWNLDDFIQSPYALLPHPPSSKESPAYRIIERALLLAFGGDFYDEQLRIECSLLLSELDSKHIQCCKSIYLHVLSSYCQRHEQDMHRLCRHSREARLSAIALLKMGELNADTLSIYLATYQDLQTADELRPVAEWLSVFKKESDQYKLLIELLLEMSHDPKWRVRCFLIQLLTLVVEFHDGEQEEDEEEQQEQPPLEKEEQEDENNVGNGFTNKKNKKKEKDNQETAKFKSTFTRRPTLTVVYKDFNFGKQPGLEEAQPQQQRIGTHRSQSLPQRVLFRLVHLMNQDWRVEVRTAAQTALQTIDMGRGRRMEQWVNGCLLASDFRQRANALRLIQLAGKIDVSSVPLFIKCFRDTYTVVRREACKAASCLTLVDPELIEALLDRFDDPDWRVRAYSVKALGLSANTDKQVRELLLWYLIHEHNPAVLAEACVAVKELKIIDDHIQLALKDLMDGQNDQVKKQAEEALATIGILSPKLATVEAQHAVTTLVKQIGTKKEIIVQVLNLEEGEFEQRISCLSAE